MLSSFPNYDALPIGLAAIDRDLKVLGWNATLASWSRTPTAVAGGKRLPELFPDFNPARFARRLESVFDHGQSVVLSATMHDRFLPLVQTSGRPLLHKVRIGPLEPRQGGALVVIEDVTHSIEQLHQLRQERRRLRATEASLRQQQVVLESTNAAMSEARRRAEFANQAKSAFLANMSHEIRTPLTAINGFAQIVCDYAKDPFVLDAAERVRRNGEHLLAVVNDILDLSKIEAGKLDLDNELCDPQQIVEEVVATLEPQALAKSLSIAVRVDESTPARFVADATRLRQVLINLVGNAIKFTDEGRIDIGVRRVDDEVTIEVVDTGVGVAPEKLDKIFQPFAQADESTQRLFGGTGLGLAICQRLVDQMGGKIRVESTLGVGSTFSVSFPAPPIEDAIATTRGGTGPAEPAGNPSDSESPLSGQTIVVAEDGPDNQRLIEFLLTRAGATVEMYENGKQAVDALLDRGRTATIDLLILDMQMPVMDGYSAAAALRHVGHAGPILALTAHAMEGDRRKALKAGCNAYATKPIDPQGLIETCRSLIQAGAAVAV